jgi:hypothetical protein
MRTKTLLLTAALVAAGVASSMAQTSNVYSLNIVGYVNQTVSSNQLYLLGNPLDDGKGDIITNVLPLNDTFDTGSAESIVFKYTPAGGLQPVETYFAGFGWFPGTNTVKPGEGFYLFPVTNATFTWVGSVTLASTNTLNPGLSLVSSAYPASLGLLNLGLTGSAAANDGSGNNQDIVFRFETPGSPGFNAPGGLNDLSTYFGGYGWFETINGITVGGGTGGPTNGPSPFVGEGFFYFSSGNVNTPWVQSFTVN